jgi:Recombinase
MAANIIISGSQYERRLISQRTRDALAAKRARGERLGAAPALPLEVTRWIVAERANGRTFQAIAEGLMADGIPTARGKTHWYPATSKAVVTSDNAALVWSGRGHRPDCVDIEHTFRGPMREAPRFVPEQMALVNRRRLAESVGATV